MLCGWRVFPKVSQYNMSCQDSQGQHTWCVSVCGVGFLLLQGLWVWAIPGGNGKGKRKAEGVSLRVLALTQPCVRPKIADLVDVVHVVSDFECNQREKGAGESVWMPWKWGKSSSIHRLQGCDQINCERVKSGKL